METPVELWDLVRDRFDGARYLVVGLVEWDRRYSTRKDAMVLPIDADDKVDATARDTYYPDCVEVCRLIVEDRK